jgi:hypothetical protein
MKKLHIAVGASELGETLLKPSLWTIEACMPCCARQTLIFFICSQNSCLSHSSQLLQKNYGYSSIWWCPKVQQVGEPLLHVIRAHGRKGTCTSFYYIVVRTWWFVNTLQTPIFWNITNRKVSSAIDLWIRASKKPSPYGCYCVQYCFVALLCSLWHHTHPLHFPTHYYYYVSRYAYGCALHVLNTAQQMQSPKLLPMKIVRLLQVYSSFG